MTFYMNDLSFPIYLFLGSAISLYLLWLICRFNGKTIVYAIAALRAIGKHRNYQTALTTQIPIEEMYLIGATPLAILSILPVTLNYCFNSFYSVIILEIIITACYFLVPKSSKKEFDLLGIQAIRENLSIVLYTILWCFIFALWAGINHLQGLDYTISNTNPDLWAYVRRFGAMTVSNLSFYDGLMPGSTFKSQLACTFFLDSPKKFSSFLGSLIAYPLNGSSIGIGIFQGMLGATLFISLFKEWFEVRFSETKKNIFSKSILMVWVLFSPPVYWLIISSYLSNTLFIIVISLTLRSTRKIAINGHLNTANNFILFIAFTIITFAFYAAFIPLIAAAYLATLLIYVDRQSLNLLVVRDLAVKFGLIAMISLAIAYLLFPSQLGLYEIRKSLNLLDEHGANFVPLNPWSLLQEKPKPMPRVRDFGWYINIIVSLPIATYLFASIWQFHRKFKDKNSLAGLVGVGVYIGYLLAYIPLENTYRLMKIAISIIYPIAIFGLLPLILWCRNRLEKKYYFIQKAVLVLAIAHAIWHVHTVFNLRPFPAGNFTLVNKTKLENTRSIAIVGCRDVHESQFYERLVGLTIARQFPNLSVLVVRSPENVADISPKDTIVYGKTRENSCHFDI